MTGIFVQDFIPFYENKVAIFSHAVIYCILSINMGVLYAFSGICRSVYYLYILVREEVDRFEKTIWSEKRLYLG